MSIKYYPGQLYYQDFDCVIKLIEPAEDGSGEWYVQESYDGGSTYNDFYFTYHPRSFGEFIGVA